MEQQSIYMEQQRNYVEQQNNLNINTTFTSNTTVEEGQWSVGLGMGQNWKLQN